ncbi:hypothetical protein I607_02865 [Alteromonas mediterranea U4]|jgi:hypothetical protein|nr:hypothetical protein I607_02865 [Alteromonas mediterranea U4]
MLAAKTNQGGNMQIALVTGIPVIVILLIVISLKLNALFSYLTIVGLGIASSFTVEYVFCSVLKTQCEPDPLNSIGLLFHSLLIIVICSVIYALMPRRFKNGTK